MELHKNARSCPPVELLVHRILGGMPVTRAASAAGVSRRTAFKWKRRFTEAGEAALVDRSPGLCGCLGKLIRIGSRRRCACAATAHGPGDRRPRGPLDGHGGPHPGPSRPVSTQEPRAQGAGSALPARSRANWSTSISRSWAASAVSATASPGIDAKTPRHRLGVRPRRHRRRLAHGLRRGPAQRKIPFFHCLPQTFRRLVPRPWCPGPVRHVRQRLLLRLPQVQGRLPKTPTPSPAHQTLSPQNQRKSRTLHPNPAPRMGLQTALPNLRPQN